MAYKVIILYRLYMPSYVLGTFTEYPHIAFLFTQLHPYKLFYRHHYFLNNRIHTSLFSYFTFAS